MSWKQAARSGLLHISNPFEWLSSQYAVCHYAINIEDAVLSISVLIDSTLETTLPLTPDYLVMRGFHHFNPIHKLLIGWSLPSLPWLGSLAVCIHRIIGCHFICEIGGRLITHLSVNAWSRITINTILRQIREQHTQEKKTQSDVASNCWVSLSADWSLLFSIRFHKSNLFILIFSHSDCVGLLIYHIHSVQWKHFIAENSLECYLPFQI